MSDEDKTVPIVLYSEGWEQLLDGRPQLRVECRTILDYATLPRDLKMGRATLLRAGWDEERKIAFFRETRSDGGGK